MVWPAVSRSQLCHRCLRVQLSRVSLANKRWIGTKYLAKVAEAEKEWAAYAERVKKGETYSLWDMFEQRGYVKDTAGSPAQIRELMRRRRIGAYVGIDPTAPSLHVGHLLPLMPLYWMYMHGYRAITLVGGSTAKIGDPSGRLKSREHADTGEVSMNMVKIHYQLKKLWTNVEERARTYGYEKQWSWKRGLLTNSHWWNSLPLLEVLRRLGAFMRIGPLLSRDSVKRKMTEGDGMSFAEFTYPLMQAWDWWHMFKAQGVKMQIGGSDQFGNIVTGIDAIKIIRESEPHPETRKEFPDGPLHDPVGFTVPLLTDSSGAKFGKSAGNALWLDHFQTKPFDLYGYFVRRPDADVEKLLKLFTFVPLQDIKTIMEEHDVDCSKRVAQHKLAYEVLCLVHGVDVASTTQEEHRQAYGGGGRARGGGADTSIEEDPAEAWRSPEGQTVLNNAPRIDIKLPKSFVLGDHPKSIARIIYAVGFVPSASAAVRLMNQRGVHVAAAPGQKAHLNKGMNPFQLDFTPANTWMPHDTKNFLVDGKYLVIRKGKHDIRIVEMVSDEEYARSGLQYPGMPGSGRMRRERTRQQLAEPEDADVSRGGGSSRGDRAPVWWGNYEGDEEVEELSEDGGVSPEKPESTKSQQQ